MQCLEMPIRPGNIAESKAEIKLRQKCVPPLLCFAHAYRSMQWCGPISLMMFAGLCILLPPRTHTHAMAALTDDFFNPFRTQTQLQPDHSLDLKNKATLCPYSHIQAIRLVNLLDGAVLSWPISPLPPPPPPPPPPLAVPRSFSNPAQTQTEL